MVSQCTRTQQSQVVCTGKALSPREEAREENPSGAREGLCKTAELEETLRSKEQRERG